VRLDEEVKDKKAQKHMRSSGRKVVIVADSIETADGVLLAGVR
jgi:hypothetical protein